MFYRQIKWTKLLNTSKRDVVDIDVTFMVWASSTLDNDGHAFTGITR